MVDAAEEWLRTRSVPKLHLMVRESNSQVTSFYERIGFELMPQIAMSEWLTQGASGRERTDRSGCSCAENGHTQRDASKCYHPFSDMA